ncbi:MAG: hypothetical protein CM1200mP10_13840 [Candidatus Neomarinimicrobiota bacterium]|nr:MAG: hypothetical protein CM1200mP10_13840 [Candidatus Neomarinimicrobiota bacterium]
MGAATDVEGGYLINNVPVGDHVLKVTNWLEQQEKPISIEQDQELIADFSLLKEAIQMQTYVSQPLGNGKGFEDAPAAISVITKKDIRRESNTNLGDYMKTLRVLSSLNQASTVIIWGPRGFNTSFSSRL